MVRVLHAVNIMDRAGLENMLMNYYRSIDHSRVQFDFLTHRPNEGAYEKEIISMGGKVFHAPRLYPKNYKGYFRYMQELFERYPEYRIMHAHMDTMSAFPLYAAKINGVPVRIAHSHTSKLDKDIKLPIKYVAKLMVPHVANQYFSCGKIAGEFLFGNREFQVVHNAIDLDKYCFDKTIREEERKKLGLENKFVVGHVGRYCYIKNQSFLIDIFKEILLKKNNARLVLVGKGEDEKVLRDKVRQLKIEDKVLFLVDRDDVHRLYQVMDVFVMPSLFEGLPVVGVEAQANGLPCIMSDKISQEILLTANSRAMSLLNDAKDWAKVILQTNLDRNLISPVELGNKGYDVQIEVKKLMQQYQLLYSSLEA